MWRAGFSHVGMCTSQLCFGAIIFLEFSYSYIPEISGYDFAFKEPVVPVWGLCEGLAVGELVDSWNLLSDVELAEDAYEAVFVFEEQIMIITAVKVWDLVITDSEGIVRESISSHFDEHSKHAHDQTDVSTFPLRGSQEMVAPTATTATTVTPVAWSAATAVTWTWSAATTVTQTSERAADCEFQCESWRVIFWLKIR